MEESCYEQEQGWKDLVQTNSWEELTITSPTEWDRCTDDRGLRGHLYSCFQKNNTIQPAMSHTSNIMQIIAQKKTYNYRIPRYGSGGHHKIRRKGPCWFMSSCYYDSLDTGITRNTEYIPVAGRSNTVTGCGHNRCYKTG